MENPTGTIVFTTVSRPYYGFDVFSINILEHSITNSTPENRLTNDISINFNGQFVDDDQTLVYISERTSSPQIYLTSPTISKQKLVPSASGSHFHDLPIIKNQQIYFVLAHEQPEKMFTSWSDVYSTGLDEAKIVWLTLQILAVIEMKTKTKMGFTANSAQLPRSNRKSV